MSKKANELLFEAATNGDLASVKNALELGAKINKASQWDGTALHIAASKGHLKIISFLLAVKLILEKGGPYEDRILSDVSGIVNMSGRYPIIADLIRKKRIELIKPSTDDCNKKDAKLFKAVYEGDLEAVEKTLVSGADVNVMDGLGLSVLRWAVRRNQIKIIEFLLEKGAEINAVSNMGWTALMEACMNGFTPIVKFLLEKGADVNIKTAVKGTAIYFAANDGHEDIVILLLEYGADPTIEVENSNIYEDYTITAIQAAYDNGHFNIVRLLQKYFE